MIFSVEHMPQGGETLYSMNSPMGISTSMASFASLGSENWMMNSSYSVEQIFCVPLAAFMFFVSMSRASSRTMILVAMVDCGRPISSLISLTFISHFRSISRIFRRTSEASPLRAL